MDWHGWLTLIVILALVVVLIRGLFPQDLTFLVAGLVLVLSGTVPIGQFLAGFAQTTLLTLGSLFVIARTIESNGVLDVISHRILPSRVGSVRMALLILFPLALFSMFFSNTALVLLATPVLLRWSRSQGISPSKLLMPAAFGVLMGGCCTLIGTNLNVITASSLEAVQPGNSIGFFEFIYVAGPLLILAYTAMVITAPKVLPDRIAATESVAQEVSDISMELILLPGSPLANLTVLEATRRYLQRATITRVERAGLVIDAPEAALVLQEGDRILCVGTVESMAYLRTIKTLEPVTDRHFTINPSSTHFSELVIATNSSLIGKTLKAAHFRSQTGASVLSIYRQGSRVMGPVSDVALKAGDALMVLSNGPLPEALGQDQSLFYLIRERAIPVFSRWRVSLIVLLFIGMVVASAAGLPLVYGSTIVALAYLATGCITLRDLRTSIRWELLIMLGSAAALQKAMVDTGIAHLFADWFISVTGHNSYLIVGGLFVTTVVIMELVSCFPALFLMLPLGAQVALQEGLGPIGAKAVFITIAIASSSSFLSPVGHITNMMQMAPGGYKFTDYTRFGLPLFLIYLIGMTVLVPLIWPLNAGK